MPGVVVPMPTLPSFLTNNNDVEALLMTLKAAAVESDVEPAIVVLAKRPVEVPIPTFPELSILILSDELVAKIIGLAPVVEAVRVPLFQKSGDLTEVEKSPLLPQRSFATVRYVEEALVIVPLVTVRLVIVPVVPQNVGRVA